MATYVGRVIILVTAHVHEEPRLPVHNDDSESPPRYLGDHPDGAYWSAEKREGDDEGPMDHTVSGDAIVFMWDYGVRVPLWDAEGLLPEEPEWLRVALALSDELIEDLGRWGADMNRLDGSRASVEEYEAMNLRGQDLAHRLQAELGSRLAVRFRRW